MTTTPTLGLTQFEATDTINFLTQYNTDLSKIDTNAKMTKAIGSDYIYSYTTPPSYSGGTVTLYSGTKFIPAYSRDINGNINQQIYTLSANKTIALAGTNDYNIYIDSNGDMVSIRNNAIKYVNFTTELPSTVGDTSPYLAYVVNEHRYFITSGSTTATWSPRIYCNIASVRVVSNVITYFKPNLQLNLAQKIGKDKLLMTMAEVNANTDKEFVPSAVAVKEMLTILGSTTQVRALGVQVANNGKICELTVPSTGTYLVNIYNSDGVVWLGLNGTVIADQASDYYVRVNVSSGTSLVFNLTSGNTLSLWNVTGAPVTYSVGTRIQLVRLK